MHIPDIKTAVEIFDRFPEIGSKEICALFGCGTDKARRLKNDVRKEMAKLQTCTMLPHNVDTETAYRVFGIDIENYRKRYARLQKQGAY